MLNATAARICSLALAGSLAACGGGGDGNTSAFATAPGTAPVSGPIFAPGSGSTSPTTTVTPTSAEGLYTGTTSTGYQLTGLVLETGEHYVLYGKNNTIYGVVQGNGTSNNGSFSSSNALDFFLPDSSRTSATVSATYTAKQSLQGTVTEGGQGITFTSKYESSYDTPAFISAIAGAYSGMSATGSGAVPIGMAIDANGRVSGTSRVGTSVCGYSGSLNPTATGKNVFNLSVTFNGGTCPLGTATISGYAVPVVSGSVTTLYAVGLLADRSNGFLAIGTRN